jgi:hypothetical protein
MTEDVKTSARKAAPTKLDELLKLLCRRNGATIAELGKATGWQAHSIRGAMAGTLRKKGHAITSDKVDGVRRYRIAPEA